MDGHEASHGLKLAHGPEVLGDGLDAREGGAGGMGAVKLTGSLGHEASALAMELVEVDTYGLDHPVHIGLIDTGPGQ
jgi:hypothetical protein